VVVVVVVIVILLRSSSSSSSCCVAAAAAAAAVALATAVAVVAAVVEVLAQNLLGVGGLTGYVTGDFCRGFEGFAFWWPRIASRRPRTDRFLHTFGGLGSFPPLFVTKNSSPGEVITSGLVMCSGAPSSATNYN